MTQFFVMQEAFLDLLLWIGIVSALALAAVAVLTHYWTRRD